ncbi:MAG: hypothetical protein R2773_01970 [Flavobacteriaceae bacterium]
MKKFKILWFEDNIQNFKKIIPNLESHLDKFYQKKLEYDYFDHYPKDFDIKLFEGIYSLALIDLNLNNGQKGIEVISIIRSNGAYIDTLLYSNNPKELIVLTEGENYLEGVFRHATMHGIQEKIIDVIDQVLYKEMMAIMRDA